MCECSHYYNYSVHVLIASIYSNSAPGDYSPVNLTLTRDQLEGGGYQITIPVLDDEVVEGRERFQGRLLLTQESLDLRVITLAQSLAEVTIRDNDGESFSLVFFSP